MSLEKKSDVAYIVGSISHDLIPANNHNEGRIPDAAANLNLITSILQKIIIYIYKNIFMIISPTS